MVTLSAITSRLQADLLRPLGAQRLANPAQVYKRPEPPPPPSRAEPPPPLRPNATPQIDVLAVASADTAAAAARSEVLARADRLVNGTGTALTPALQELRTAWQALATAPHEPARQADALAASQNIVKTLNQAAQGAASLQSAVEGEIATKVDTLNDLLLRFNDANRQVRQGAIGAGAANDPREALLKQITSMLTVKVVARADGDISLFTPNGGRLVDGGANRAAFRNGRIVLKDGYDTDVTPGSGELGALHKLAVTQLPILLSDLDTLARGLAASGNPPSASAAFAAATGRPLFTGTSAASLALSSTADSAEALAQAAAPVAEALQAGGRTLRGDKTLMASGTYADLAATISTRWTGAAGLASQQAIAAGETNRELAPRQTGVTATFTGELDHMAVLRTSNSDTLSALVALDDLTALLGEP